MRRKTREDYQRAEQQQALRDVRRAGLGGRGRMGHHVSTAAEQELDALYQGNQRGDDNDPAVIWGKRIAVLVFLLLIASFFIPFF